MPEVMTVLGPIAAERLGMTLPHEHIFVDLLKEARMEGLLNDRSLMEIEVGAFRDAGGESLVDCTSIGLGRDVAAVRDVAVATGLNIVVGTGFYRHPYLDREWFDANGVDAIADLLVSEIEQGIGGTDIRAGIIGEIGCDRYLSAAEERSFRAAARAHHRTDLTITTHAARWPVGVEQLDLLAEEGVDPYRVIVGHCDRVADQTYAREIAARGAFIGFDGIRPRPEYELKRTLRVVLEMIETGHIDQVLLSQDVCLKGHLGAYGGGGYTFLVSGFLPMLRSAGVSEREIRALTVENPRRAITGERR